MDVDIRQTSLLLFILYCVQGIPYGFQSRFLPMHMRKEGSSLTYLGLMKLLYIPWIIKTVWAPFVDSYGTKLIWLQSSISVLMLTCLVFSCVSIHHPLILISGLFVMNLAASIQDIAVDAFAISTLKKEDLGIGNVAQVVGYKAGAVIGGGIMIALSQFLSWSSMFLFLVGVYCIAFITITCSSAIRQTEKQSTRSDVTEYWHSIWQIFDVPGTFDLTIFLLLYKLCDVGCLNMLPLYLIDKGQTIAVVGFWTGIVGQCASVGGSALGGWLVKRSTSTASTLNSYCWLRIPLMLLLVLIVHLEDKIDFPYNCALLVLMNMLLIISGIITTATFTFMMELSQTVKDGLKATHFTTLSTAEVLGKLTFSVISGVISDYFGYFNSFVFCVMLAFLTVIQIKKISNSNFKWNSQ